MRPLGAKFAAFVEAHIEQGTRLDEAGVPIGVVERIQGARWFSYRVTGTASHAGTTSRPRKRDALEAAVGIASQIYEILSRGDEHLRLTIGRLCVEPGSINVVPAEVNFTVDLRHPSLQVLDDIEAKLRAFATPSRGSQVAIERTMEMRPALFDEQRGTHCRRERRTSRTALSRAGIGRLPRRPAHNGTLPDRDGLRAEHRRPEPQP